MVLTKYKFNIHNRAEIIILKVLGHHPSSHLLTLSVFCTAQRVNTTHPKFSEHMWCVGQEIDVVFAK